MLLQNKCLLQFGCAAAVAVICVTTGVRVSAATADEVAYPDGFRHWTHIKSGFVGDGSPAAPRFAGLHNVYANEKALGGFKTGTFAEGSVVVFDDLNTKTVQNNIITTDRKQLDVMQKTATGWVFGEFAADSHTERSVTAAQSVKQCVACHNSAPHDHVFSEFVE